MTEWKRYNRLIGDLWPNPNGFDGEVGIEVEVEGRNLPRAIGSYWRVVPDGSLRNGGLEYVLLKPIKRKNVLPYLQYLRKKFEDNGAEVQMTTRTSVHVHLNAADLTMLEVLNWLIVYFIVEELLVEYAGPTRVGNMFCLRAKDSEYLLSRLAIAAAADDFQGLNDEQRLRYASVNVCALSKFNSLEFRSLRGTVSPEEISTWVDILLSIKDVAKGYKIPTDIIQDFSAIGPRRFLRKVLPAHFDKFEVKTDIERILWDGMRVIQDVAYSAKWEYSEIRPIKRVFGNFPVPSEDSDERTIRRRGLTAGAVLQWNAGDIFLPVTQPAPVEDDIDEEVRRIMREEEEEAIREEARERLAAEERQTRWDRINVGFRR